MKKIMTIAIVVLLLYSLIAMPLSSTETRNLKTIIPKGGAPYYIYGYVYDTGGITPLANNPVTITDVTLGEFKVVSTDGNGYYQYDISIWNYANGDLIKVNATDGVSTGENTTTVNVSQSGSICNVTLKPEATLSFNQGWNFIVLPLYNTTYRRAEDLAQAIDNCTYIKKWNSTLQEFETHKTGTNENNFTLDNGTGYLVYVTQSSSFVITGNVIPKVTMSLEQGWNSIGRFNSTAIDAKTLASSVTSCTAVAYWNNALGRFVAYLADTETSNFSIERGRGYLVYVTAESSWVNE